MSDPAFSDPSFSEPPFSDPLVGIIGGTGHMGLWFRRLFEGRGLRVETASRRTTLTPAELASRADVLILSVPINAVAQVAADLGPRVREQGLLMDLSGLKEAPVAAMLAHSRCEVIGAHPLFGPGAPRLSGHTVVVCPARGEGWLAWLTALLEAEGGRIVVCEPAHHDRLMAAVQGLTHFDTLSFALALARLGLPLDELLRFATPNLSLKLKQAARLLRQDAGLYAHMEGANPHVPRTLSILERASADLRAAVLGGAEEGNFDAFQALFGEAAAFFSTLGEDDYRGLTRLFLAACEHEGGVTPLAGSAPTK